MKITNFLLFCILTLTTSGCQASWDNILSFNKAKAFGHKWVMKRCLDQEKKWMDTYPVILKSNGGYHKTREYASTVGNIGRRHLLKDVTKAKAMLIPKQLKPGKAKNLIDLESSIAVTPYQSPTPAPPYRSPEEQKMDELYHIAKKSYLEYVLAAKWVEEICVQSGIDRGPSVLVKEMPSEVYSYMVQYHTVLMDGGARHDVGSDEAGATDSVKTIEKAIAKKEKSPSISAATSSKSLTSNSKTVKCQPQTVAGDTPNFMIVVIMSMAIGVGIGVGGTIHVLK
mmetsp:Transcript_6129/g.7015  ORF Transcript_6129/g.7015 Transcript_6129/m.7015 type:complete len:283 (+) Transcript_6129:367-1215(+)|eukprot:CAMPEP_0197849522 /NCGR_PEP_ID=MMETSP1438-20131217/12450_1 /TAXON_ID=1461541 /ORGANISM="Pterosperma sp., Strain CCMP1384" /LENGTH=282 /DNA_ID=CAMNT_0043462259 /DNA_START=365 /DNA_END=1213 /DNA_ORIENTATION=+